MKLDRLFVHIGLEKTGSTSLQKSLKLCRSAIEAEGIALINPEDSKINYLLLSELFWRATDDADLNDPWVSMASYTMIDRGHKSFGKGTDWLKSYLFNRRRDMNTGFISFEQFESCFRSVRQIQRLGAFLSEIAVDVIIIVCLRDEEERLESLYSTALRAGYAMTLEEFLRFRRQDSYGTSNAAIVRNWRAVFGDKVNIVEYARGDTPQRVLALLGLTLVVPSLIENATLSDFEKNIVMRFNNICHNIDPVSFKIKPTLSGRIGRKILFSIFDLSRQLRRFWLGERVRN